MNPPTTKPPVTLTPAQIQVWRSFFFNTLGPLALMVPDTDIQFMRDQVQAYVDHKEAQGGPLK